MYIYKIYYTNSLFRYMHCKIKIFSVKRIRVIFKYTTRCEVTLSRLFPTFSFDSGHKVI